MQGGEHTNCWEKYEVTGNDPAGLEGKIFGSIRNRPGAMLVPAQSPLPHALWPVHFCIELPQLAVCGLCELPYSASSAHGALVFSSFHHV